MRIHTTAIPGVHVIDLEPIEDERGSFARTFCADEFVAAGLNPRVVQCNTSFNRKKGTLRGLHYQAAPHEEAKLIRVTAGAIFDVVVDVRPTSLTYRRWLSFELVADEPRMLYIPEGCAHGFQTLRDDTEIFYQMSAAYHPELARGIRWDDPAIAVEWPAEPERIVSAKDEMYPLLEPTER